MEFDVLGSRIADDDDAVGVDGGSVDVDVIGFIVDGTTINVGFDWLDTNSLGAICWVRIVCGDEEFRIVSIDGNDSVVLTIITGRGRTEDVCCAGWWWITKDGVEVDDRRELIVEWKVLFDVDGIE